MFKSDLIDSIAGMGKSRVFDGGGEVALAYGLDGPRTKNVLFVAGAVLSDDVYVRRYLADLLPDLRAAVPFVFRDIPFFDTNGEYMAPRIGSEGLRQFNLGRCRPPFAATWLEYKPDDSRSNGLLVVARDGDLSVHLFATGDDEDHKADFYRTNCYSVTIRPLSGGNAVPASAAGLHDVFCYRIEDESGFMKREKEEFYRELDDPSAPHDDGWRTAISGKNAGLEMPALYAVYMLLILSSNARRIETAKPSVVKNMRRSDRGLTRIPEYRVVTMPGWTPDHGFAGAGTTDDVPPPSP